MRQLLVFLSVLLTAALLSACGDSTQKTEAITDPLLESDRSAKLSGGDPSQKSPANSQPDLISADPESADPDKQQQLSWPDGHELLDKQGFVEVAVTPLNLNASDETLRFSVGLNTHSIDLSMDLAQQAVLELDNGLVVQGLEWDAPRGGHHVSGVLSFPRMANGNSLLSNASQLTLIIYDIDASERAFTWNLTG